MKGLASSVERRCQLGTWRGGKETRTAEQRHFPRSYPSVVSYLPMLLQLAMTERRDIVALKLLIFARVLLLRFAHCKESRLYPLHDRSVRRYLCRCLVNGLRHHAL